MVLGTFYKIEFKILSSFISFFGKFYLYDVKKLYCCIVRYRLNVEFWVAFELHQKSLACSSILAFNGALKTLP